MGRAQHVNALRLWLVAVLAALPLLGASELGLAAPVVVVYPLTVTGSVASADTGSSVATAIANKLVELGGITVKPYVAGTPRQQYLTAAVAQDADYYITGYITPLGSEVSVVEQVVSTRSGSIVYSTTAFARTYADAVGPTDLLREAILHHAGRGMASLNAPPPSPSPAALGSNGGVNISKAFGRHRKGAPAAATSPSPGPAGASTASGSGTTAASSPASAGGAGARAPSAAAPQNGPLAVAAAKPATLVVATEGTADPAVRAYASQSLAAALLRAGAAGAFLPVGVADVSAHAAALCRANGAAGFVAPTLAIDGSARGANVVLDVVTYDCNAVPLARERATGSAKTASRTAVQGAVDAAAGDLAKRLARRRGTTTRATPPAAS